MEDLYECKKGETAKVTREVKKRGRITRLGV
jgi:hypothetical protein